MMTVYYQETAGDRPVVWIMMNHHGSVQDVHLVRTSNRQIMLRKTAVTHEQLKAGVIPVIPWATVRLIVYILINKTTATAPYYVEVIISR